MLDFILKTLNKNLENGRDKMIHRFKCQIFKSRAAMNYRKYLKVKYG